MDTDANNPEFRKGMPPKLDHVKIYFSQKNISHEEAEVFFYYHQDLEWRTESGLPIIDWRAAANEWVWNLEN